MKKTVDRIHPDYCRLYVIQLRRIPKKSASSRALVHNVQDTFPTRGGAFNKFSSPTLTKKEWEKTATYGSLDIDYFKKDIHSIVLIIL